MIQSSCPGHIQVWSFSHPWVQGWMLSLSFLTFTFYVVTAFFNPNSYVFWIHNVVKYDKDKWATQRAILSRSLKKSALHLCSGLMIVPELRLCSLNAVLNLTSSASPPPQKLSQHYNILVHFKYISFLQAGLNARLAWCLQDFQTGACVVPGPLTDVWATSSICCPVFGLHGPHSQPSFSACLLRCLFCEQTGSCPVDKE